MVGLDPADRDQARFFSMVADDATFLSGGTTMHGKAEVIIGKQRHGPTGTVQVHFDPALTKFDNLVREEETLISRTGGAPTPAAVAEIAQSLRRLGTTADN